MTPSELLLVVQKQSLFLDAEHWCAHHHSVRVSASVSILDAAVWHAIYLLLELPGSLPTAQRIREIVFIGQRRRARLAV